MLPSWHWTAHSGGYLQQVGLRTRQVSVTWLCHGPEQLASVHEAFQSLVRQRGTVCRWKWRRHHWHSDSSLASWKLRCFYVATTRQRSRHNFYHKTAWNINTVTELNWTFHSGHTSLYQLVHFKDWHRDGYCSNTAVIPAVMGTFVAVIPREWGWSHGNTVGMGLEFAVYPR